jgi:hypothetical protein
MTYAWRPFPCQNYRGYGAVSSSAPAPEGIRGLSHHKAVGQRRVDDAGGQARLHRAGAHADLLVVDGDPLKDILLLAADGKNLRMIVRAGEIVKDELR